MDNSIEQAPRIDEMMMSSQKKRRLRGRQADYYQDGVVLLASRLEIQVLKRMKTAFYAISSSTASQQASSCVFEGRRENQGGSSTEEHR